MAMDDIRRAALCWGDDRRAEYYAEGGLSWLHLDSVMRRVNEKISGDPDVDWIDHLNATHLEGRIPVERCLSLCCGSGRVERELAERGIFERCLAYDASEEAIERAKAAAGEAGHDHIEYAVRDVNVLTLAKCEFDLVVAHMALHHINGLEHVASQIRRGLKPDGLLVALEYVGPERCEYSQRRLEICDSALRLLPEAYRKSVSWQRHGRVGPGTSRSAGMWAQLAWRKLLNGTLLAALRRRLRSARLRASGKPYIKREAPRIPASEMAVDDPTEAVRSSEVRDVLESFLDIVEYRPFGGAILMWVLDDIAGNFEGDDPAAQELLAMLFAIEDSLMAAGEIESDFAYIVAAKREAAGEADVGGRQG